jgi:dihydroflavonol-4-reductase
MSTALVTGGCGFIGQHLVAALQSRGERVRVLDVASSHDLPAEVELFYGSILDSEMLARAMAGIRRV